MPCSRQSAGNARGCRLSAPAHQLRQCQQQSLVSTPSQTGVMQGHLHQPQVWLGSKGPGYWRLLAPLLCGQLFNDMCV